MQDNETSPASHAAPDEEIAEQLNRAAAATELHDPDEGDPLIDRIVNKVVEAFGVGILAVIVSLVFANAASRYGLNRPLIWTDEIVIELMPWLAMCGVFLSVRRLQLIRIDYFVNKLHHSVATALTSLAYLLSAAAFVKFAYVSFGFVSLFGSDTTVYLQLPRGWFLSAFVVGSAAVALAFLINSAKIVRRRP